MLTTAKKRAEAVVQANANAAIEGFEPDPRDMQLQTQFINGEIGIDDLLQAALADAAAAGEGAAE